MKRKIRKLGYVWGFVKKKVVVCEVNKKGRCKMVKREKWVVSYEKRVESLVRMG